MLGHKSYPQLTQKEPEMQDPGKIYIYI